MPVAFQRDYVDLLDGDVLSALMLSQIVYWYRRDKKNAPKLKGERLGIFWMAKSNKEWKEEIGLSSMQCRRCLGVLKKRKLIQTEVRKFFGTPVNHLRLLYAEGASSLAKVPTAIAFNEFCSLVAGKNSTGTKGTDPLVAGNESSGPNPPIAFVTGNESNALNPPVAFVSHNDSNVPKISKPFVTDSKSLIEITSETTAETTAENTAEISTCLAVPAQAKAGGILLTNDQGKLIGTTKEEKLENSKNAKDATYGSGKKSNVLLPQKFLATEGDSDLPTLEQIEANADQPWPVSECKPYPEVTGALVELGEYVFP